MIPSLSKIDHVHIYVKDRKSAETWYRKILGFFREPALELWETDRGPLTLTNTEGTIHLALFEGQQAHSTVIAFATGASEYMRWHEHLRKNGILVDHVDHQVSWSMYFTDPEGNPFEITCYDYEQLQRDIQ